MNALLNGLKQNTNFTNTENGGITHKSTLSKVLDLFAMGGAYRNRNTNDILTLFTNAYHEDKLLALKCLFYLRDVRGGQGERRFFRECLKWLAENDSNVLVHNILNIPEFGRYDDLYTLYGTNLQKGVMNYMKTQLVADMKTEHPSLLAKWMKSENAHSKEGKQLAKETREYFHWSAKQYRSTLSALRKKIDIVERKMSSDHWTEINYPTVPSKAGLQYRKAFLRHDEQRYSDFINNKDTKVKAATLYPYEIVEKAGALFHRAANDIERKTVNKYWENLTDFVGDSNFSALCMVDTSGSMHGRPINAAISLGIYFAERANGPFKNHYISFSSKPQLVEMAGYDFVSKVQNIYNNCIVENTNIQAAFQMLLNTAKQFQVTDSDMPKNIIVISDMEFDSATRGQYNYRKWCYESYDSDWTSDKIETTMETIANDWKAQGYTLPNLIYWNVDARQDNIPMIGGRVSYVSGFSPTIFETIIKGKTGYDLMLDKLNSKRYESVTL